jgi:hypothetical protein
VATLDLQVDASTDDAWEQVGSGVMNLNYGRLFLGKYSVSLHHGFRWKTGLSGQLAGATINAGTKINFPYAHSSDSGSFFATWYAEDAEAPPVFASGVNNIKNRARTTASTLGGGAEFGTWASGNDYDFPRSSSTVIADIIQELADNYDPSAIVLLHIYASGSGERIPRSWDYPGNAYGAKLHIDYTAGGLDTTATPDPVVVPIAHPAPTIVAGAVTLAPDPVEMPIFIPIASGIVGAVTATPDPVVVPVAHPTPTAVVGSVTATPDPVVVPIAHPAPLAISEGLDTTLFPDPVVVVISHPTPTVVIGGVTATPDPVVVPIVLPTPSLSITALPDSVLVPISVPAPSVTIGGVTVTPDPVVILIAHPLPSILGGGEQFVPWGIWDAITQTWLGIEQTADPDDFAPGSVFRLTVAMYTAAAGTPVNARLYNITDGIVVAGSEISGTATAYEILRSGTFYLPNGTSPNISGRKTYRLEVGGLSGGAFYFHGGKVIAESS